MIEREVLIRNEAGVHARPAMMLVKEAMKHPCDIFIIKDDVKADGKSIMSVLTLTISAGSKLIIRAVGRDENDEKKAVERLVNLIESNFKAE